MSFVVFTDAIAPYLYFSTRREIRKINVRQGSNYTTVLDGLSNTIGIDFDWSEQQLYYSDVNNDKIVRCFLNGSKCEDVITTGLSMTEGKTNVLQYFSSQIVHPEKKLSQIEELQTKNLNKITPKMRTPYVAQLSLSFGIHGNPQTLQCLFYL